MKSEKAIGLLSPARLTRATRGGAGINGAETAGMATVETLARRALRPCRLYADRDADRDAADALRAELVRLDAPPGREVRPLHALSAPSEWDALLALHAHGSDLHGQAHARARYAPRIVPLTCMQYSISQIHVHHGSFLQYLLADLYPCDAAICTTRRSRQAQLNILARLADALEPRMGKAAPILRHEVIPYPIDTDYFRPFSDEEKRAARLALGLPLSGRIALYTGRFDSASKSDLQPLLLAFRYALRRLGNPADVHLALAGYDTGGEGAALKAFAGEYGFADRLHVHTDYPPRSRRSTTARRTCSSRSRTRCRRTSASPPWRRWRAASP